MLYMNIKLVKPKIHSAVLQYILPLLFLFLFAIGAKAQSTENVEKNSLFSKVETTVGDVAVVNALLAIIALFCPLTLCNTKYTLYSVCFTSWSNVTSCSIFLAMVMFLPATISASVGAASVDNFTI